jgi:hypothetical protein
MVCCVFQATNLVNNYEQRKSARTFVSRQKASNKLYTVLAVRAFFLSGYFPLSNDFSVKYFISSVALVKVGLAI